MPYEKVGNEDQKNMKLGNKTLKEVKTFKYLGVILNKQQNSIDEIMERINKGE